MVEKFLSLDDRQRFRDGMAQVRWTALKDLPQTSRDFPESGNWSKAGIQGPQVGLLMNRLAWPCITSYVESFPGITGLHMSFNYYSYGATEHRWPNQVECPPCSAGSICSLHRRFPSAAERLEQPDHVRQPGAFRQHHLSFCDQGRPLGVQHV